LKLAGCAARLRPPRRNSQEAQNPSREYSVLRSVGYSRGATTPNAAPKKQSAGRHEAFRRSNCAFLTLVGKGDAKSRHSKILLITAVTGFKLRRLIDDDLGKIRKRNSEIGKRIFALRTLDEELIRMVFLAE